MDFFISYTKADLPWAEWIAWQLELAGYTLLLQAWDFRPGSNFVLEMDKASREAEQTIAVLSPNYLDAAYTHPEWACAFARDPKSEKTLLLPLRVLECHLNGLLAQLVYIDLVGLDETDAKNRLLAQVRCGRAKPLLKPVFPAATPPLKPAFPATRRGISHPATAELKGAGPSAPVRTPSPEYPYCDARLGTEFIRNTEQALAKYMGPISARLVREAAKEAVTPHELCSLLAAKLRNVDEQKTFLRDVSDTRHAGDAPAAIWEESEGRFAPSLLATACNELVKYVGPIAKNAVDKAARASVTHEDLYGHLAGYLRSEAEKTAFLAQMPH